MFSMNKIINVLPLSTIIEHDLFKEKEICFNQIISLESKNNIEFSIKPFESLIEMHEKISNKKSIINYAYIISDEFCNLEKIKNKIVTLIKNEDNDNYLIIDEPKNSHNMNKLYVKKYEI